MDSLKIPKGSSIPMMRVGASFSIPSIKIGGGKLNTAKLRAVKSSKISIKKPHVSSPKPKTSMGGKLKMTMGSHHVSKATIKIPSYDKSGISKMLRNFMAKPKSNLKGSK